MIRRPIIKILRKSDFLTSSSRPGLLNSALLHPNTDLLRLPRFLHLPHPLPLSHPLLISAPPFPPGLLGGNLNWSRPPARTPLRPLRPTTALRDFGSSRSANPTILNFALGTSRPDPQRSASSSVPSSPSSPSFLPLPHSSLSPVPSSSAFPSPQSPRRLLLRFHLVYWVETSTGADPRPAPRSAHSVQPPPFATSDHQDPRIRRFSTSPSALRDPVSNDPLPPPFPRSSLSLIPPSPSFLPLPGPLLVGFPLSPIPSSSAPPFSPGLLGENVSGAVPPPSRSLISPSPTPWLCDPVSFVSFISFHSFLARSSVLTRFTGCKHHRNCSSPHPDHFFPLSPIPCCLFSD
jgi:hypothetical protein